MNISENEMLSVVFSLQQSKKKRIANAEFLHLLCFY